MADFFYFEILPFIRTWFWIPLSIIYIGIIVTILIENRHPNKTISWILVILALPIVGIALYYLFGQKFLKVKSFREKNTDLFKIFSSYWEENSEQFRKNLTFVEEKIGPLHKVFKYLMLQKVSPPCLNNEVELLINGNEKFPKLIEHLKKAKYSILMEYYIFELDHIGKEIIELLISKAREGVEVKLLVDGFGSPQLSRKLSKLEKAGVECEVFLPVSITSLANSNYRNHRKLCVIDGEVGFLGGINISDRYINKDNHPFIWRDTSVLVRGSVLDRMQKSFWHDWIFSGGKPYTPKKYIPQEFASDSDSTFVAMVNSDPGSPSPYNLEALLVAISEAREEIQLCTPYFIPSDELTSALQIAAGLGVKVRLMLPEKGDSYIVQHASMSFLKPLLIKGVEVYLYKEGFLHAKTALIDGKLAFVGTVNLDTRSFFINFESSLVIVDEKLCAELQEQFEMDMLKSYKLDIDGWMGRSKWNRGLDSVCRLFAPLL